MDTQEIKDYYGNVLGRIVTMPNGDKEALNFYGQCLGKYIASSNVTTDFYGTVVAQGDVLSHLICEASNH